jgi:fructokinase
MLEDIVSWGVKTDFVFKDDDASTPIVIERLRTNGHGTSHVFEFKCPKCGALLPGSRPLPGDYLQKAIESFPLGQVFYFDRVSKSAIEIARRQKESGALVVFEPSWSASRELFKDCLRLAHVVKYSNEQIDSPFSRFKIPLEIQTLGAEGLRYRSRISGNGDWVRLPAFHTAELIDSVGAGDWCTAGILQQLGQNGSKSLFEASQKGIRVALELGQALGALCCKYEGARGMMYALRKDQVQSMTEHLVDGTISEDPVRELDKGREWKIFERICISCQGNL